jgi:hypothetical protein
MVHDPGAAKSMDCSQDAGRTGRSLVSLPRYPEGSKYIDLRRGWSMELDPIR